MGELSAAAESAAGVSGVFSTKWWDKLITEISNPGLWTHILWVAVEIAVIYVAGKVVLNITNRTIQHIMKEREKHPLKYDPRRANTMARLTRNVFTYVINFIMVLMILGQLGVDLRPILAGAGVIGLAVGFGAQSLVKDIITGFFIIFEDQFAVGDVVQAGTFKGTVEEIGLRITRIKSWTGEVMIIPNGQITQVTNFSVHNSIGVVDVSVAYESDIDRAMEVIKATAYEAYEANENMIKEPEVLGVQTLGAHEIIIRIIFECKPMTQFGAARELNAAVKKRLDQAGIEIPYPKVVNYHRTEKGSEHPYGA